MKQHLALSEHLASAPAHWEQRRFRHAATLRGEKNSRSDQPLLALSASYGVRERGEGGLGRQAPSEGTISSYWKVRSGDLVVNPMWLIEGGISCSWLAGAVSPAYRVYVPYQDVDSRYLHHLMRSRPYIDQYNQYIRGLTTFDRSVSVEDFLEIPILVPPLSEQRRIADFLDAEVVRIDGARGRRKQVSSLAIQRHKALVDLEMDRLVEECGTLPFRRFIMKMEQGSSPQCDNYPAPEGAWGVLKVSAVKLGVFRAEENKNYSEDPEGMVRYEVREGNLLITRANTPSLVGSVALVPQVRKKLILSDKIFRVSISEKLDRKFLVFVAGGSRIRDMCAMGSHGTSQSMVNLKSEEVKAWPIPAAPLAEQLRVSKKLEESRLFADQMRGLAERQIELLEERKSALITAAVTGQIDVTTARGADLS